MKNNRINLAALLLGIMLITSFASAQTSFLSESEENFQVDVASDRGLSSKQMKNWGHRFKKNSSKISKRIKKKSRHKKFGIFGVRPVLGGTLFTLQGSGSEFFEVDGTNSINLDYVPGVTAGLQADIGFGSTKFVFETGLFYMETGGRKDNVALANDPTRFVSVDYRLQYFSIPLNAKYYFNRVYNSSMYLRAGLIPSFFTGIDAEINIDGDANNDTSDGGIRDLDLIFNTGVGGQYKINPHSFLFLEANFYRGLINLTEVGTTFNQGFGFIGGFSINM